MFKEFLEDLNNEGKVRVVYPREPLTKLKVSPVITLERQVGVLFQDLPSGKSWFVELDNEIIAAEIVNAVSIATITRNKLIATLGEYSKKENNNETDVHIDRTTTRRKASSRKTHC